MTLPVGSAFRRTFPVGSAFRRTLGLVLVGATSALAQPAAPADATFEIAPRGYVQFDWRAYPDWSIPTGTGRLNHDTFEIRRARVGTEGRWRGVSFEVTVDPGDDDGVFVKDAYAEVRVSRAIRLRAGQFKVPGTREYATSARSTDFMERAALADWLAAGRDIGGMMRGDVGQRFSYEAGLFVGDGNGRGSRAGTTGAGRGVWNLPNGFEVGGTFSMGRVDAVDTEAANGLVGRASSGYRFFEEVYVDGWRVRSGVDGQWTPGPWRISAEFLRVDEQRSAQGLDFEDLPRAVGSGWSAAVTRQLGRGGRVRNRWREFDLGFRLERLGFDDSGPATGRDSVRARATDIRPRAALTSTAGVSWSFSRGTKTPGTVAGRTEALVKCLCMKGQ